MCQRRGARPAGLEPATSRVEAGCSIQLSYGRVLDTVPHDRRALKSQDELAETPRIVDGIIVCCSLMSDRGRKVLQEALELPPDERAHVIVELLASFDGEADADVDKAWAHEIELRAREALKDPDDDLAWETVRAELRAGTQVDDEARTAVTTSA